jgi:hypothetical protein
LVAAGSEIRIEELHLYQPEAPFLIFAIVILATRGSRPNLVLEKPGCTIVK